MYGPHAWSAPQAHAYHGDAMRPNYYTPAATHPMAPGTYGAPGAYAPQAMMAPALPPPLAVMRRPNTAFPPVRIQQPTLVSSFSYDEQNQLHLDDSSKRYFHEPPTARNHGNDTRRAADLNYGFERFREQVRHTLAYSRSRTCPIRWTQSCTR